MKIVGLTGGIASGKSTVSSYLKEKAYVIVDADLIARKVVTRGSEGLVKLVDEFTEDILNDDKSLNRKKLGAIVFNDPVKLEILNSILHPLIKGEILSSFENHKSSGQELIIFDCPLLFESGYESLCDETWLVSIKYETQIKRLIVRDNIDKVHASKIIKSQMTLDEKAKRANVIIDNEASIVDLYKLIDELLEKI